MKDQKNNVKDFTLATVKGAVGTIPFIGALFSEYISLAQDKIADKRMQQWMGMVEEQLLKLQDQLDTLADDELFYSVVQVATTNAMRAYQEEKLAFFAHAIYNTALLEIESDKKLLFLSLLDHHTLTGIKLLRYYSQDNYNEEDFVHHGGMMVSRMIGGTEYPMDSILKNNPHFKKDSEYIKTLSGQLANDGLIFAIDFGMPESPERARRKRTTKLGDEFLSFITTE